MTPGRCKPSPGCVIGRSRAFARHAPCFLAELGFRPLDVIPVAPRCSGEGRARILPTDEHDRAYAAIARNWSTAMKPYEKVADRVPVELAYVEVTPA